MKATGSFGVCLVLDTALQQSTSGDGTGLAVYCLPACKSSGICISNKQHRHKISEVWEFRGLAVVSRTGGIGSTYWGLWNGSGLYWSICLLQGIFLFGDAEKQEAHMGQIPPQLM